MSVSIPSDADYVLFCATGYAGFVVPLMGRVSFDPAGDLDFPEIFSQAFANPPDDTEGVVHVLGVPKGHPHWPGAGTHDLYTASNGNYGIPHHYTVLTMRGVDTEDPFYGAAGRRNESVNWTFTPSGVEPQDRVFVVGHNFGGTTDPATAPNAAPDGSGQTLHSRLGASNSGHSVGSILGAASASITTPGNLTPVGFVIRSAPPTRRRSPLLLLPY